MVNKFYIVLSLGEKITVLERHLALIYAARGLHRAKGQAPEQSDGLYLEMHFSRLLWALFVV